MTTEEWELVGEKFVLLVCAIALVLYAVGVIA